MIYHIIDNIFLSNLISAQNIELITSNNITIICRLSEDTNKSIYPPDINFYNFQLEDNHLYTYELLHSFHEIIKIISLNKNCNILIHCNEGKSRSVSIIILYLMIYKNMNYQDAYNYIKQKKRIYAQIMDL